MNFSSMRFSPILSFLASIAIRSFGELILLRHPPNPDSLTINLTCISEDDNSALVWNIDSDEIRQSNSLDFQPEVPTRENVTECGIWNLTTCFARWENKIRWKVVNSIDRPMGPVFDYRWEGFEEFYAEKPHKYTNHYVTKVKNTSGSVSFSVQGRHGADIYLCENDELSERLCFLISINYWYETQSSIRTCVHDVSDITNLTSNAENCTYKFSAKQHDLYVHKWRTYRIEWNIGKQTIEVFENGDDLPFLKRHVDQWRPVSHVLVKMRTYTRIRFHFYEYFIAENKDEELSTEKFHLQNNVNFCFNLLISLCSDCELKIHLIDENDKPIATKSVFGVRNFTHNRPLYWRSVNLTKTLKHPIKNPLRLKIETILNDDRANGQWAVDNFRLCKSDGGLRESIIQIRSGRSSTMQNDVTCQKLSYRNSATVYTDFRSLIRHDSNNFQQSLDRIGKFRDSPGTRLGKGWGICNTTVCTCDRGYWGSDCTSRCDSGFYGYGCYMECSESCARGYCNGMNGHCDLGCNNNTFQPPLCGGREFEKPTVINITDTTARIFQNVEPELVANISSLRLEMRLQGKYIQDFFLASKRLAKLSTYEVNISNLQPETTYMAQITMVMQKFDTEVEFPAIYFTTAARRQDLTWLAIFPTLAICMLVLLAMVHFARKWQKSPRTIDGNRNEPEPNPL